MYNEIGGLFRYKNVKLTTRVTTLFLVGVIIMLSFQYVFYHPLFYCEFYHFTSDIFLKYKIYINFI